MGDRRMCALSVVECDAMSDLELGTQLLYHRLVCHGDDDGFVANPRSIARSLGLNTEHLTQLISSGFLIRFDSGVVVVVHWHMQNKKRKDRHVPTQFQIEYKQLFIDDNGIYRLVDTCQPVVNHVATQEKKIKEKIIKENKIEEKKIKENIMEENERQETAAPAAAELSCLSSNNSFIDSVLSLYKTHCTKLKPCVALTEGCKAQILALQDQYTLYELGEIFRLAGENSFLTGGGSMGWVADLTWLTLPENLKKVQNQVYTPYKPQKATAPQTCLGATGHLGQAELEAIEKLLREH